MKCADRRSDRSGSASPRLWLAAACLGALVLAGCSDPKQAKKVSPSPAIVRDVPQPLRGTIGAEATFRGIEPTLVSGLGIVVGLNGTGGSDNLDAGVQATMERELARGGMTHGGIGQNYEGMEGVTPQEFLRSNDVAVVIVEAKVAPGAPEGTPFDVHIRTLPGSSVTSLEGGQLWTTDLRIGPAAVFGAVKTRRIAMARGPIFINPFSGPSVGAMGDVLVTRTTGRILGGGRVTDPLQIEMALDSDSFARARSIVSTINSRFPREAGDEGPIARGRGNGAGSAGYQSIAMRVPRSYAQKPEEFIQLVRHMRVDPSLPEEFARQYVEDLKTNPGLADDLRWCLQAIGRPSLPFLASMYEYSELAPRLAALTAGARLGDPRAAGPLMELARKSPPAIRVEAIRLLGDMPTDPRINIALRDTVSDSNLDIRVAAYESLRKRGDVTLVRVPIGEDAAQPRFTLEMLPLASGGEQTVYVTQQGDPRIVLFGGIDVMGKAGAPGAKYRGIRVNKPILVSLWNDRFMLSAETATSELNVFYRDPRGQASTTKIPEDLGELIEYLAHKPTPEDPKPGLAMTYSQVVGVLAEMSPKPGTGGASSKPAALSVTFATEEDRLRAEVYEAMQTTMLADRPETESDALKHADAVFKPTAPMALPSAETKGDGSMKSRIVPLKKPAGKGEAPANGSK